nr:MAG TPA: hypothetical protein [Caudoviricetes sp.]DAO10142.1 MAG TPA: hypothetical protein [Caudoviricetes sp.]
MLAYFLVEIGFFVCSILSVASLTRINEGLHSTI